MFIKSLAIAVISLGSFRIFESLVMPKSSALRTNDRMDDQKSQRPQNDMSPRDRDEETLRNIKNRGKSFGTETDSLDAIDSITEKTNYIADNANTLDDVYFFDDSMETRKTGNIKLVKRYEDQSLPECPPCECKYIEVPEPLGYNIFPSSVVSRICSNTPELRSCPYPYRCDEIMYPMAVLRMKSKRDKNAPPDFDSIDLLPPRLRGLSIGWNPEFKNVSVGCTCTNRYVSYNKR